MGAADDAADRIAARRNGDRPHQELLLPLTSLSGLPVPVIVEQGGRIALCNPAAARLFGRTQDSVVGLTPAELLGVPQQEWLAAVQLPQRTVPVLEARVAGAPVHVEVLAVEAQLRGAPALHVILREAWPGVGHAAHASAEAMEQAQKMDAVGRLASGIAHDFNNILTAIRGHADILLEDLREDDTARDDALAIQRAAERGAELTGQLLTFARGRPTDPVPVDVNDVVQDVRRLLRRLIRTGVELQLDLQRELPLTLASPAQLQQVVLNLMINASEAVGSDGVIKVSTRSIRLREAAPEAGLDAGDYVQLCVTDNGNGMSDVVRQQLFEPFFTTKPQGTGLGLSTVHGITRKLGGVVQVHSNPHRGTTFEVLLPIRESAA